MLLNYYAQGKYYDDVPGTKELVLDIVRQLNDTDCNYIHIWFTKGKLSVLGGHSTRVIIIADSIVSGTPSGGRLLDSSAGRELLTFKVEAGKGEDEHLMYSTIDKVRAIELIEYYFENNKMPEGLQWAKPKADGWAVPE